MQHFQTRYIHNQHFKLLVYQCFRWASTTRGRHSHEAHQAPQTRFHQAGVEETANSLLKNSAKIHLKNRRLHKSTQTRAPTIEILPVQSPNRLVGITRTFSGRDKLTKKIAKGNTCNVENP
jgi:hypothetical protein